MTLNTVIDKIRINTFAAAVGTFGIYNFVDGVNQTIVTQEIDFSNGLFLVSGVFYVGMSIQFTRRQNRRYEGIVSGIQKNGYDERFCSMYMDHLCGRSAVKTALKRTGNFDKYAKLKTKYPLTRIA